ncbi:MAG TPA: hypothetical protein VIL11_04340 [Limnochordales bacterium]
MNAVLIAALALVLATLYGYVELYQWRAQREHRFLTRQERLRLRQWRVALLAATAVLLAGAAAWGLSYLLAL